MAIRIFMRGEYVPTTYEVANRMSMVSAEAARLELLWPALRRAGTGCPGCNALLDVSYSQQNGKVVGSGQAATLRVKARSGQGR
jgi:hypothetical protein